MTVVDDIKQRLDIVEVVGQYVQLQKAGRNLRGLCPFHSERTPSFFVSPERQSWHCFGACATGGDVISFVMKKEGLEFGEALHLLAERAGVRLPERREEDTAERERSRQANEAAAQFYQHALLHSEAGQGAKRYLEERGLDLKAMQAFQLGFSPPGWENLCRHLRERGFQDEELLTAGLATVGERGLRDLFRQRIIFPIADERGRVVGFGGRAFASGGEEEAQPKYLNTPQTPLFDKGSLLYALDRAREQIRREGSAVIVEGYMDAIAAQQHGFGNVVASMGTALTERQVRLLKRFSRDLILALDADTAGQEATLRAVEYQQLLGRDIRVVILPEGRDPDQVIREEPDAWPALLDSAQPLLDYKFQAVAGSLDLSQPWQRSQAVDEMLPLLGLIGDRVIQAHYLQRLARLAQTPEDALYRMLRRGARRRMRGGEAETKVEESPKVAPVGDRAERYYLALLLRYPELREEGLAMSPELFWQSENRQLFEIWHRSGDLEGEEHELPEGLDEQLRRVLATRIPPFDERTARAHLKDCARVLEERELRAKKYATSAALAAHEANAGVAALQELEALAQASPSGAETEAPDTEGISEAAELHLKDMEIGIRLHRRSKIGSAEEED